MKRKTISFREGIRRWYKSDRANLRYQFFMISAACAALLLFVIFFRVS